MAFPGSRWALQLEMQILSVFRALIKLCLHLSLLVNLVQLCMVYYLDVFIVFIILGCLGWHFGRRLFASMPGVVVFIWRTSLWAGDCPRCPDRLLTEFIFNLILLVLMTSHVNLNRLKIALLVVFIRQIRLLLYINKLALNFSIDLLDFLCLASDFDHFTLSNSLESFLLRNFI